MNFLAHQFLSFGDRDIQIGNLYGEIVKGNAYRDFPEGIQKGILLHRQIDSFTDSHPVVKESTSKFHKKYGKYAPIIIDVFYDYYLIRNWDLYSKTDYESFVSDCYAFFREKLPGFTPELQYIIHHLLQHDWFHNYSHVDGLTQTLRGISHRSRFDNRIYEAADELKEYDQELDEEFRRFFPDLLEFSRNFLEN